jgi:hypothetical protein
MSTAQLQLDAFLDKFNPDIAAQARAVLDRVREFVPGALELVYDNYHALVIAFGPTPRAGDTVLSVAVYPRWVTLFFMHGAALANAVATRFRHFGWMAMSAVVALAAAGY